MSNNPHRLTPYAQQLRRDMTRQERHLWYDFLKTYPVQFKRQYVCRNYILDFYCAKAKLAVELDGSQHYEIGNRDRDMQRTKELEALGMRVLRFTNLEIEKNFEGVRQEIHRVVMERSPVSSDQFDW